MAPRPVSERWQLLKAIFQAAKNLPPDEQRKYLDTACASDSTLRAEAEALLAADREQTTSRNEIREATSPGAIAGSRIGAYEILHEIGKGGMAKVYAAARVDQQFQKLVAIKIVRPGVDFGEIVRRFRHERQLLAGLEHPNIARLLDGGVTEQGLPYLVMEYIEGVRIDRYADAHNLSLTERLVLIRQVCSAVQYAHQNLVVHRDLKPGNILVSPEGAPKLLDFGIAKLLRPSYYGDDLDVTLPNAQPMTPEYASPEQIRGESVTTASDVYSLGVLLYVLVTGRHPFEEQRSNAAALSTAILEEVPAKPSAAVAQGLAGEAQKGRERWVRELRGDLDTIVLMALRKEPQRRYRSVEHLADDLGRYMEGRPVSARKDTAWYRAGKFVRRHRAGTLAAAVAVVALLTSSAAAIYSAVNARRERATAERRFEEGRQFARFVLFQLDGAMQSGITPARKLMVERALEYLNGLEKDSAGDASLEQEAAEGYLKVGDLQGNLFGPNLGDSSAAKKSYERALDIAQRGARTNPQERWPRHVEAMANIKLGNLFSTGGGRQQALEHYRKAENLLGPSAGLDPQAKSDLLELLARIGFTELQMGDAHAALETYVRYRKLAQELADAEANGASEQTRRAVAYGYERVGYLTARTGATAEGLSDLRRALSAYQELAAASPENGAAQRDLASTYALIGDIVERTAPLEAAKDFRSASRITETLAASDPNNAQYQRDRVVMLGRLADALANAGHTSEARAVRDTALLLLKRIETPAVSDYGLVLYCQLLLIKPRTESSKAEEALRDARELVARTKEKDPFALQFVAEALDATGDPEGAVVTEQKALELLPRDGEFDSRADMEKELAGFRAHAIRDKKQRQG